MYGLVDCNNFYVSCERVFNPLLKTKPVVVLSNNDGCIIARSNEAKALGIPMGAPLHLYKELINKNKVFTYSSNYTLYGDMSSRVMTSLNFFVPDIEIYSIDEAFLSLEKINGVTVLDEMVKIRKLIYQWTGIPVSIGVGPTKTLAKLANKMAKKHSSNGVYILTISKHLDKILKDLSLEDIWGISKGWANRLKSIGINNPFELQQSDPRQIRNLISVVGERIVYELRGIPCLTLEGITAKQSITVSRSFGNIINNKNDLKKALANYVARAAEKLRSQNSLCGAISVFIHTNRFRKKDLQYSNSASIIFDDLTDSTNLIIGKAFKLLESLYLPNYNYKKIGVVLLDIQKREHNFIIQDNLFTYGNTKKEFTNKSDICMKMLDSINAKMGKMTLFYGSQGIIKQRKQRIEGNNWKMRSSYRSPFYTTNWNDILRVS
ncbi:MAG: Y-family DNA polymerase [Alphaproteobacteria bacterium]|nr:Y-family DNA polymerase [Alphaproteobacteria bacterium]